MHQHVLPLGIAGGRKATDRVPLCSPVPEDNANEANRVPLGVRLGSNQVEPSPGGAVRTCEPTKVVQIKKNPVPVKAICREPY